MTEWFDYLNVRTEGTQFQRKPFKAEQKKWADWCKTILKKWPGQWCLIYEVHDDSDWDWYFEATQDNFNSLLGRYDYDFRYPSETKRDNKEIWARKVW